jgi:hypothetical protein
MLGEHLGYSDQRLRQVGLAGSTNRFCKDFEIDRAVEVDIEGFDLDRCFDKGIARHTLGASPTLGRGLVGQRYGVLLIARLAAAHEHDGIVVSGVGQPRPGAQVGVQRQGIVEMPLRLPSLTPPRREQAEETPALRKEGRGHGLGGDVAKLSRHAMSLGATFPVERLPTSLPTARPG